ncbi:MAG: hypothetical protein ACW960_15425 [Candidatus Thorarchaeota archaeon]|jgi:hypothetical protein
MMQGLDYIFEPIRAFLESFGIWVLFAIIGVVGWILYRLASREKKEKGLSRKEQKWESKFAELEEKEKSGN